MLDRIPTERTESARPKLRVRLSLFARLTLLLSATLIASFGVAALVTVTVGRNALEQQAYADLEAAGGQILNEVETFLAQRRAETRLWSGVEQMSEIELGDPKDRIQNGLMRLRATFGEYYREIMVLDASGRVVASTNAERRGMPFALDAFQLRSTPTEGVRTSDLVALGPDGPEAVVMTHAVDSRRGDGLIVGHVVTLVDWGALRSVVRRARPDGHRQTLREFAILLDGSGRVIAGNEHILKRIPEAASAGATLFARGHGATRLGAHGSFLAAMAESSPDTPGSGHGWRAVVFRASSEAFSAMVVVIWSVVAAALIGLALAGTVVFIIARSLSRRIQRMGEATQRLAAGDLEHRIEDPRDDELGQLGRSFNAMAHELSRSHAVLEAEVERRTRALVQAEEKYRTIFENAIEGTFQTTPEGRFLAANPALARLFGYDSPEDLLVGIHDVAHQLYVDPRRREEFKQRLARDGRVIGWESEVVRLDGGRVWISENCRAVQDACGNIEYYEGTLQDITARRRAEEDLRRSMEALEAARQRAEQQAQQLRAQTEALARARDEALAATLAKSEFVANTSHELRTPLNGIIGMTSLLLDTHLDAEQKEYAEVVRGSADVLLTLINDILDFSKIEAGRLTLETVAFEPESAVEEVADLLSARAAEKDLELVTVLPPAPQHSLLGDPGRIRQVLLNLAGNAVKFTETGSVVIRMSVLSRDDTGATLRFEVEDTGIGIPRDRQESIFDSFTQADGSTTRRYGGTGLGLTISRQLVQLMGGALGVESEPGRGSRFWFDLTLPLAADEARPSTVRSIPAGVRTLTVVLLESHAATRSSLADHLDAWGCTVSAHATLAEAAHALAHGPAGAVLLVSVRPQGPVRLDDVTALREASPVAHPGIIVLTAVGDVPNADTMRRLGIHACVTRPVRRSQILNAIEGLLEASPRSTVDMAKSVAESAPLAGLRVLLAEDNVVNQKVALRFLEHWGCRADAVASGSEALMAIAQVPYDVVLMDVQMPDMDGLAATAELRRRERGTGTHLHVIAMTAHARAEDRTRCLDVGMDDYLSKPIEPPALFEQLRALKRLPPVHRPRTADAGATAVVLDLERLADYTGGDARFERELLREFAGALPSMVAGVRVAVLAGEPERLTFAAHSLKGSARTMGADRLADAAEALERLGLAGTLDGASAAADRLDAEAVRLREEIERRTRDAAA